MFSYIILENVSQTLISEFPYINLFSFQSEMFCRNFNYKSPKQNGIF